MNREEVINVIAEDAKLSDFSNLTSRLSFDARRDFLEEKKLIATDGSNLFYTWGFRGIFSNLFTEEEALKLIKEYSDFENRSIIFLSLSDEEKVKYIDEMIDNDGYEYDQNHKFFALDQILSINNQEIIDQIIFKVIDKLENIGYYEYREILSKVSDNLKKDIFNKMVEDHSNGTENIINEFYVANILNELPINERKEGLIKILSLKDNTVLENGERSGLISFFNIDNVLETIPKEDEIEVLKEIVRYMQETNNKISVNYLLKSISMENFKEAFKILYYENYEMDYLYMYIKDFTKDDSNLVWYIDACLELQKELGKELITGTKFAYMLDDYPEEIQEKLFNDYVFNKKIFSFEKTIIHMKKLMKYELLDKAIVKFLEEGYSVEEIANFIDKRIINRDEDVSYPDGTKLYDNINNIYIKRYNLNPNNFNRFIERFGYIATKFLDSQNIINALKMSEEDFLKYLEIFKEENIKLNNNDVNTVCNALFQREFRLQQTDDYNIFSIIESLLDHNDIESKNKLLQILLEINNYTIIGNYTDDSIEEFIAKLYTHNKETINILHAITNNYIALKREIYSKERLEGIGEKLNLRKKISKQSYKKSYIEKINIRTFSNDIKNNLNHAELSEDQLALVDNYSILQKLFSFKMNPSEVTLTPDEKKYLKALEGILNLLYEKQIRSKELEDENTIYEYEPFIPGSESILGIMTNINPDIIKLNVLSDDEVYEKLLNIMKKYHILGWNNTFNPIMPLSDITFEEGTVAAIISYYNEILPKLEGEKFSLTKLIDYGNVYDATSQVYRMLLGKEDYSLIAANEGKNKASMSKYKRLEQVPELVKKMYEREYVTIPPMDKNIELSNKKKLNVVIGNSTNMMNLTYGERTNACLRIGGAFNDLFRYCIENPNGFHIRFTNPETNKFVSRVSGIRNGNTLFLNELRCSEDENYTNEDLRDAIDRVAEELIEESKNSSMPIDNIVITSDYALKAYEKEEQPLNIDDRNSALKGLNFNIKDNSTAIVLKTSDPNNSLVEYHFTDEVPRYSTQREKIKTYYGETADNKVTQIHMIDELLSGKNIDEMPNNQLFNCQYCICSSDWYIAIDKDNIVHSFIMPNTHHREQAEKEMLDTLKQLNEEMEKALETDATQYTDGGYKK